MCTCDRRHFVMGALLSVGIAGGIAGLVAPAQAQTPDATKKQYICPPCGCDMDGKPVADPGACSACGMPLVEYKAPAAPAGGEPKTPPAPAPKTPTPTPG